MTQKKQKKPLNKRLRLIGAGIQMGITIYLFVAFGKWLDTKFNTQKTYLIICTLVGVFSSLYLLIKQLKALEEE